MLNIAVFSFVPNLNFSAMCNMKLCNANKTLVMLILILLFCIYCENKQENIIILG